MRSKTENLMPVRSDHKAPRSVIFRKFLPFLVVLLALLWSSTATVGGEAQYKPTTDQEAAILRISADSLRGHLSFIASDALQGRDTPSPGLDIAAEYIAAQFRRAGLVPAGNEGYFQTAPWMLLVPNPDGFRLTLTKADQSFDIPATKFSMTQAGPVLFEDLPLVKLPFAAPFPSELGTLEGKAVIAELPGMPMDRSRSGEHFRRLQEFLSRLRSLKPAMLLALDRTSQRDSTYFDFHFLRDPDSKLEDRSPAAFVQVTVNEAPVLGMFDALSSGSTEYRINLRVPAPREKQIALRNVVGVLPGSDPVLKESYILLTAHYDHVGMRPQAEGDKIWNGANDDGSGTVSVIEIASTLATLKDRPRRSLVFIAFFGEEKGLLGSRYYGRHPAFPLEKTIASVNLEQLGRTDSTEGDQSGRASLTGFDYSDIGEIFQSAGRRSGIDVYKHAKNSDPYFGRSDNQALANLGIPSHTLCVAFDYPDYHGAGDHWEKVDYDNMAKTDRMVALALLMMAQSDKAPQWNTLDSHTARYVQAWEALHPK